MEHLNLEGTKYFAIAHAGIWVESDFYDDQPILIEGNQLEKVAAERGLHMIGHFGIDETGYMSAGPHSYFDQYPSGDDLPNTMTHWVHSRFGQCG